MTLTGRYPRANRMIKRIIKKETVRCTVKNYTNDSILVYRLVRSTDFDTDTAGEEFSTAYYSISIIRLGNDGTRDEKMLTDISRIPEEAEEIYRKIAHGTVPPETADEIMDDILGV